MRIPYGFSLTETGALEVDENMAKVVQMIFDYYLAGASLGKVVDMLYKKQVPSPTGKANGHGLRLITFSLILNILPLLALKPSQIYNLKNLPAVMSTTTKRMLRANPPVMSPLL